MKHIYLFIIFLIFSVAVYSQSNPNREILVFFSEGIIQETKTVNGQTQKAFKFTDEKLKASLNKMGVNDTLIEVALSKFNKSDTLMILKTGERIQQPDMTNLYRIKVPEGKKRQDIIDELKKMPEVLYAEPNGKVIHHAIPSDMRFGDQWGLRNTIRSGAGIHAEAAWDIYTGNANNIIAIVDGGTQTTHVDLNDKISGFQLSKKEWDSLRYQFGILKLGETLKQQDSTLENNRGEYRKYLPYAFM